VQGRILLPNGRALALRQGLHMKQPSNDVPNIYSQNGYHLCAKQTIQEFYKFAAINECAV
jgi:hypothetical protein